MFHEGDTFTSATDAFTNGYFSPFFTWPKPIFVAKMKHGPNAPKCVTALQEKIEIKSEYRICSFENRSINHCKKISRAEHKIARISGLPTNAIQVKSLRRSQNEAKLIIYLFILLIRHNMHRQ